MCTIKKDIQKHCETIKNMTQIFKESGIEVVNGTHNSELLKKQMIFRQVERGTV